MSRGKSLNRLPAPSAPCTPLAPILRRALCEALVRLRTALASTPLLDKRVSGWRGAGGAGQRPVQCYDAAARQWQQG